MTNKFEKSSFTWYFSFGKHFSPFYSFNYFVFFLFKDFQLSLIVYTRKHLMIKRLHSYKNIYRI